MMSRDQEIYEKIGELLMSSAPKKSNRIIMRAELSNKSDHCRFEFDWVDGKGNTEWYMVESNITDELTDFLIELNDFFVSQNQPSWNSCQFTLEINGKFGIEFDYD